MSADRLRLYPAAVSDAAEIVERIEREAASNLNFFREPVTLERQQQYLERMTGSSTDRLFLLRAAAEASRLIGSAGLHELDSFNGTARLGLLIFRPGDRGKGLGREAIQLILRHAFNELELNKVYLNVFAGNHPGQSLYARLGFVPEGRLRQEYLLDATRHNLIRMAVLREEWAAGRVSARGTGGA